MEFYCVCHINLKVHVFIKIQKYGASISIKFFFSADLSQPHYTSWKFCENISRFCSSDYWIGRSGPWIGRSGPGIGRSVLWIGRSGPGIGRSGPWIGRSGPSTSLDLDHLYCGSTHTHTLYYTRTLGHHLCKLYWYHKNYTIIYAVSYTTH